MARGSSTVLAADTAVAVGNPSDKSVGEPYITRGYKIALDPNRGQELLLQSY
jgi:hypothetical protein